MTTGSQRSGDRTGRRGQEHPAGPGHDALDLQHEYRAATGGCGVVARDDRCLLRVHGRAPAQMLNGILTNRIPEAPVEGVGDAVYGTMLTAKGRMVTDLTTLWLGAGGGEGVGLNVSVHGAEAALNHFQHFLPPRMAKVEALTSCTRLLTVAGPGAGDAVASAFGVEMASVFGVTVGKRCALLGGGPLQGGLLVARGVRQIDSWDLWIGAERVKEAQERLCEAGAKIISMHTWETLRIEAGFPEFGIDMDNDTIPIEAGLGDCAFDHNKGCYTGQEVIVRILHRGHVNWHLRSLRFGESAPQPGMELFQPGNARARGRITSVAHSPRLGQGVGLGYVRREIEPPATLRLESEEGAEIGVV